MRYDLYDVLSDYSLEKVPGKSNFGTLKHAKERAVKDNSNRPAGRSNKITWHKDTKWGKGGIAWKGFNTERELINIIVAKARGKIRKGNPNMKRKKKRSAKQLANDKRLGRMAKARAKKKRGGRRKKVTRKRNVVRKGLPKVKSRTIHANYQVASWSPTGKKVVYHDGVSWAVLRNNAALWHSKAKAENFARRCGRACAVVTTRTKPLAIKQALTGKM